MLSLVVAWLSGCATARASAPEPEPTFPSIAQTNQGEEESSVVAESMPVAVQQVMSAPAVLSRRSLVPSLLRPSARSVATAPTSGGALATASPRASGAEREMLEIEATLNIVVEQVPAAAVELRKLVRQCDAVLIEDAVDESNYASGRFLIRVLTPGTDALLAGLERLGQVRNRAVNARDIGKQYHDAELKLDNLKVTMDRYQQILAKAENVADIISIEHELGRLRGEIEQVKGNLRWMQDRVARSTIHVNLASPRLAATQGPIVPEAKFYPGLRGILLEDLRGDNVHQGYLGGGLSLRVHRAFSLDIDGLRQKGAGSPIKGLDVILLTIGGETYSEFLGNGTRRFANPFLGWRLGYARFLGHSEFALGATAGLEIVKTRYVRVDLAVRGIGFLGKSAHFGVAPELTVGIAF
jgi:hypothetical protein